MLHIEKHKNMLVRILKDIYTNNTIGPVLGFKGGTAAFLFYDLPRFSVDLDFDLLSKDMDDQVFEAVRKIISNYGKIKTAHKKYFTLFFELSYAEDDRNIKVEINRRNSESHYEIANYFGISMKIMCREDMFANKLLAMYERIERTNRDIFDIWFFLEKNWPIKKELVEKRSNMPFKKFLAQCIKKLETRSKRSVLAGMGELLNEKQKNWAREKLIPDTIFFLKLQLDNEKNLTSARPKIV